MGLMPFMVAAAVVTGPITGGDHGQPFSAMPPAALAQAGYTEAEYFFGGTATAFTPTGPLTADGAWTVKPDTTAEYKVRMLVRRPADAKAFNGIVVVEWLNVTALLEGAADFMQMQEELLRQGYAWVGRRRAGGGREFAAIRAQELGQDALRIARASRGRLLLRHLLAGGRHAAPSERRQSARSAASRSRKCWRPGGRSPRSGSSPTSTPSIR
jgi:hypothetical protein